MGEPARQPAIATATLTNANTQYSLELPPGVKQFTLYTNHASANFRIAFLSGAVAAPTEPYLTVFNGNTYYEDRLELRNVVTIFLASATAGTVVNCLYWT